MGAKSFNGSFFDLTKLSRCVPLIICTLPMASTDTVTIIPFSHGASCCHETVCQCFQLVSSLSKRCQWAPTSELLPSQERLALSGFLYPMPERLSFVRCHVSAVNHGHIFGVHCHCLNLS